MQKKYFDFEHLFYPKDKGELFSKMRQYESGDPFGINSEEKLVTVIKEIFVNGVKLPTKAISDLINPNRFETILSIKPIKVYDSSCEKYLFIYVFATLNTEIMTFAEAINFSYMAKIITDKEGHYIGRIVVPGNKLKFFGFGDCPHFIGF